jgi:uncharacterized protein YaeQ
MALSSTIHRFKIALSDVDRGVYETLDLRAARHPSETMRYMLTRVFAYCLSYEEGIEFSQGLSNGDEPAVWIKSLDGRPVAWIEVGTPSGERLHRASKGWPRVLVYTHHDPALLQREATKTAIHRVDRIEAVGVDASLLDALEPHVDRTTTWELVRTEGQLYVNTAGKSFAGALTPISLTP